MATRAASKAKTAKELAQESMEVLSRGDIDTLEKYWSEEPPIS